MSAIPTLCLLDVFQIFCGPENLGWDRNTSSRSGLEKVMFMPKFVMFFYESWRTNNQYSCAQYTVYSVHEYFTLSCHQLNEFQKRQKRQRYAMAAMPNATCSPDPSKPQPLRSLIGGSLADSVGFHVCHIGSHSHLSYLTGWMTWIIFLTQRQGSIPIPWSFCFIQPTSTAGFASRVSTNNTFPVWETLQAPLHVRFLPATADMFRIRVKVTCWSSSFESPTFENFKKQPETNWDLCIPLPVLAPPTCSSTPATGPQELLYTIRDIQRSVAWKTISVGGRDEQKQTSSKMARGIIPSALLARAKFCLQHCKPWETSEAKTRNNGRFRSRSFAPWFFKRFRSTEPSSGFGVL